MCGFIGFSGNLDNKEVILQKMMDRIVHRGPDMGGMYTDDGIALGFRRLSILDLSDAGAQPMANEDKSVVVVFNGEIYNFMELRRELEAKGHTFHCGADTEVLIHGYEEYGTELIYRLRGMFAFVLWDAKNKRMFGARDIFGIKPFYYYPVPDGSGLVFGSEIKAFLEHPKFVKAVNENALRPYLTLQYSATEETFFKGVYKLPAAHYFVYENGKMDVRRFWDCEFDPQPQNFEACADKLDEVVHESVAAHRIADVKVGSFLSGGVDSSYMAALAHVDKTFTVGFANKQYDETDYAQEFSKHIGVKNYAYRITPEEYWANLGKIQYHMDEPLADPAAIALYFVCNLASQSLKVVLSGEGADEIFGGYNVYSEPGGSAYDKLPRGLRRGIGHIAEKMPAHRGRNFLVRKGKDLEERFIGNAYMFTPEERKALLKIRTNAPDPMAITKPFYDKVQDQDDVTKMQYLDLHMWMAGDILLKADKMSMANSLELRVPFLDKKVMELAEQIPTRYRVTREAVTDEKTPYITKYAMRLAAKKDTPPQTAKTAAKKKLGFPVPIRVWLKEDKYYSIVRERFESDEANRFFHTEKLVRLLDDHRAGKADNSRKIWTLYMFLVWYQIYFPEACGA